MLADLLGAALIAAAPLDAPHAAVLAILSADADAAAACKPAELHAAAAAASVRTLGRVDRDDVVLAQVANPCICGAQNCPYYAIRLVPTKPRVLLATMGVTLRTIPAAPLPQLVVRAHDSAAVAVETKFVYRDGNYTALDSSRVRWRDDAHKPEALPVHFAARASTAELRGSVSVGWYDGYVFDAAKGQTLAIDGVRSRAHLSLLLFGPHDAPIVTLQAGTPFRLPASGRYRLQVDNNAERDIPYTLTLAIR